MRISDWSSDVCSSDLVAGMFLGSFVGHPPIAREQPRPADFKHARAIAAALDARLGIGQRITDRADRKSVVSGKSVSGRVDLGGRRIIKKKNNYTLSI